MPVVVVVGILTQSVAACAVAAVRPKTKNSNCLCDHMTPHS